MNNTLNNTEVKKITIIGGGTSAWLSAAYLTSKGFYVTVIDKEIGNSVGVGEATILGFGEFMSDCGFEFNDWFINCDATFKAGILYPNWIEEGNEIWHPFYLSPNIENNIRLHDAWTHNQELDFKTRGLSLYDVSKKNKIDTTIINSYAFHIDAGKLVKYIQERLAKQCSYIQSEVTDVIKDNLGNVQSLKLRNNNTVYADLFIDCTGFSSVINKDNKFENLYGRLFCNTAIAGRVEYTDKQKEMRPYTKADAVEHGWVWTTPIASRIGSGLVFDRNITSVDEAKNFFVKYWDNRVSVQDLRVLDWTPRYTKTPWVGNVVSIGLSAGFIEPLESTGIALIQSQVRNLVDRISDFSYTTTSINLYNSQFEESFENTVDFVSLHYSKTKRTEPFWQNVIANYEKSDGIKIKEKMLQSGPLYTEQRKSSHIFSGANWTTWLVQMGYEIGYSNIVSKQIALDALERYNTAVEQYRHTWSIDHSQEVDRMRVYSDNYLKR
tara:strand:- start:34 stop:1518 length:1485 start_codon:yes stop_codon:yes gene_type:complete